MPEDKPIGPTSHGEMVGTPQTIQAQAPRVAVLGWCDRAARIESAHPALSHISIQGLSGTRVSHFFPFSLRGSVFVLGVYNGRPGEVLTVEFRHSSGNTAFGFQLIVNNILKFDEESKSYQIVENSGNVQQGWFFQTFSIDTEVLILEPDTLKAFLVGNGAEQFLGQFHLVHASHPPYSADQVAALRSDPLARKMVRIGYSCSTCGHNLRIYAGLEKSRQQEEEGWQWFADLPDEFRCGCGKMAFSLMYLRTGLHGLLSRNLAPDSEPSETFLRLYEVTKLEEDCRAFKELIDNAAPEERVQDFLEKHPVFFSRFTPHRLIPKPKILTKFVADFAILNQRKELLLVEIEKPGIRLLTKERRITADLQHAVTQVTDWIQEVNDHRAAVLDSLKIELREVAIVRGVVVAGRSPVEDEEGRALRRAFSGSVDFFTYDDLLRDTAALIRQIATA